jgi:hypothetical protein
VARPLSAYCQRRSPSGETTSRCTSCGESIRALHQSDTVSYCPCTLLLYLLLWFSPWISYFQSPLSAVLTFLSTLVYLLCVINVLYQLFQN